MNIVQAEENLKKITTKFSKESFIFDLMQAYGFPNSTISKLKIKLKKNPDEDIIVTNKLHFLSASKKELDSEYNKLVKSYSTAKKQPRFVIVTDFQTIKAYDTKMGESLDTDIKSLPKHPDFFLPWAGIEKKVFQGENPADVKAAEKLAKVFDLIKLDNPKSDEKSRHALNVFLTRVLFCFFAEDTDIFDQGLFTTSIASHTGDDGKDLADYFSCLFEILNTDEKKRPKKTPEYLNKFPYVNGGLFAEAYPVPKFSKKSRSALIELGDLNWAEINPDIFGSMIQAVVHPDQRAGLGMHYTSVANIMKAIEPLFLNDLHEEFEKAKSIKPRLRKLLERVSKITVFDPACGAGNFLIIAYKELRHLEMKILKSLGEIPMSGISLSNFYGIEIDDFAHEVAKLSLWLAEHQMDVLFNKEFGNVKVSLPLKESGQIICGNACRIDWETLCSVKNQETYIIGNPPYGGAKKQLEDQQEDMLEVFKGYESIKMLDYIACWFLKASHYVSCSQNTKFSFVSTTSLCQGLQVSLLWPKILEKNQEIFFAHQSFIWSNNARDKAKVRCVIIGVRNKNANCEKYIFSGGYKKKATNISPYLIDAPNIIMFSRDSSISNLKTMANGSNPTDGNNLIFSQKEYEEVVSVYPQAKKFFKKYMGASDFIEGVSRYCLWINDSQLDEVIKCNPLKKRLDACRKFREGGGENARKVAHTPHRFARAPHKDLDAIIFPLTTSDRRTYVPIGYVDKNTVISNTAFAIYGGELFLFSILSSRLHTVWQSITSARMGMGGDYRYSVGLTYNTFPLPKLSEKQTQSLELIANEILRVREKYPEKSIGDLYDPDKIPADLLEAHLKNDRVVESIYTSFPLKNDEDRLNCLFSNYIKLMEGRNV